MALSPLAAEELGFGYPGRRIGEAVTFALAAGEVLCLLGPNGGGKTTLFKTLLGLLPPQAGRVMVGGRGISSWSRHDLARLIAYIPQAHAALFPFTVREVVLMGRAARIGLFAAPSAADRAQADRALSSLGISHLGDRIYTEVSGGERQLTLIARALVQEPQVLIMDEPTSSLDFGNQGRVLGEIAALAGSGMAVILSTHDPDHAFLCADRVALLHQGRLAGLGAPHEVVTAESLRLLYGIEVSVVHVPALGRRVCSPAVATRGRAGIVEPQPGELS